MGVRQDALAYMLTEAGYRPVTKRTPRPILEAMGPQERAEVLRLYRALGGKLEAPLLRPGAWDCVLDDGLVVELDEGQHFNRYRRLTLKTSWAQRLPWQAEYLDHCALYEGACLTERGWGAYWTSKAAERSFGRAGPPRMLDGAGSPCWKQRALFDAMRDISALSGVRLVRLAVYDVVGGAQLDDVLDGKAALDRHALRTLIKARTASRNSLV